MQRNHTSYIQAFTSEMNTINQLYSTYEKATPKEVRELEGLKHKLVKQRDTCIFNLQCLHEEVIPSGYRMKSKSNNIAETNIIRRAN